MFLDPMRVAENLRHLGRRVVRARQILPRTLERRTSRQSLRPATHVLQQRPENFISRLPTALRIVNHAEVVPALWKAGVFTVGAQECLLRPLQGQRPFGRARFLALRLPKRTQTFGIGNYRAPDRCADLILIEVSENAVSQLLDHVVSNLFLCVTALSIGLHVRFAYPPCLLQSPA